MATPSRNFTDLAGRVAVVIGGTSGLGRAIAVGLAEAGADVVPTGRRGELVAEVAAEIRALGRQSLERTTDVKDRASIEDLRDAVRAEFGHVDVLVNAAGITCKQPTAGLSEADWAAVMETNLTGTLRACQSFYATLRASLHARVVNIASVASLVGFHQVAAYSASKAGVLSLTRSLGCEWARDRIAVNALMPGIFPTDLNRQLLTGTERGRELLLRTPAGRFGRPDELVGAAVFLASDAASFITGQAIAIDGGFLASGVNS